MLNGNRREIGASRFATNIDECGPFCNKLLRLLDSMIYRTLAHLQWIILVLLFVVLGIKGG